MNIGVVGAGTMGTGIALAFAAGAGNRIVLTDAAPGAAARGLERMGGLLDKLVGKGKIDAESASRRASRVEAGAQGDLSGCGLIVEAIVEDMAAKRALFSALDAVCRDGAIFASNTSTLSITELGAGLRHDVVGMHFFNPAHVMALVEVTAGMGARPEAAARVRELAGEIGKTPVDTRDSPGFVVNRVLIPMINEAIGVFAEGVASAGDVDAAMRLGANHPMGPLALGDLIGLDVCLAILDILRSEFGDPRYRPHPLLRKMVRAGRLGRKTKIGFFPY